MQLQVIPDSYLERNPTAAHILLVIAAAALALAVYLLPAFIGRRKPNARAIARLNLLLGWTVVGWIVALSWAIKANADRTGS